MLDKETSQELGVLRPDEIDKKMNEKDERFKKLCDAKFKNETSIYKETMQSNKRVPPPERYPLPAFGIYHYAALVTYNVKQWWDLNKSTLPRLVYQVAGHQ